MEIFKLVQSRYVHKMNYVTLMSKSSLYDKAMQDKIHERDFEKYIDKNFKEFIYKVEHKVLKKPKQNKVYMPKRCNLFEHKRRESTSENKYSKSH